MAAKKKVHPKKKAVSRKKTTRRKNQKPAILNEFKKILVGLVVLVAVCLTGAMIADIFIKSGPPVEKKKEIIIKKEDKPRIKPIQEGIEPEKKKAPITGLKEKSDKPIKYEVFDDVDHTIVDKPLSAQKDHIPRIAIIIDDIGYDKKVALALCLLDPDITFSVLPFSPFGKRISEKLHANGAQLMLHLPMEPIEYPHIDPGPGALLFDMSPDDLLDQLKKDILDIPYIVGVNNHMGSKLTSQADQMNQIFTILKKDNLFFIDSRTSPKSQGSSAARLLKVKFAHRDVFLDNLQEGEYITGQFKQLINLAKKHGSAIGIGHPYKITLETLSKELPKLKNKIHIVRAGTLTAIPG